MKNEKMMYFKVVSRMMIFIVIFFSIIMNTFSQQPASNESELITSAQILFDTKDYQAALPLYAQLVSVHPDDPQFNYKFGVCTLFGDRKDKKKPIKYLNNALQSINDDQELYYYLGMAYHQNQEFANAMKYFNLYISKLPANSSVRATVLEKVNACLNGLNLADKNLIAEIISTSKFQKENFHRAYAAQDFNGSLMIKPEIFVSDKEKKSGESSYVFLIHPSNVLYFSGFSNTENNNRDIFKVEIDDNGEWGIPERLNETINTSYDENYPVLVDNGNTLYFCSKGHNSLGGYDIFRSTLDEATNKFSEPENLGPGINSPFDDYEFIPTRDKSYVYFASDRDNLNGTINVYKVRLVENAFSGDLIFAENNGAEAYSKSHQPSGSNQVSKIEDTNVNTSEDVAQNNIKEPSSEASKKANSMINNRSKSMLIADSAFIIITSTKEFIRDLTNKRDRANAISQRKADEARTLEARFNESIALLANATDEKQFLEELDKSVKLKEELYQLQQRSSQANKIAWNLGNQVKTKNQELNSLKTLASKIQATSVTGSFEETLIQFTNYKKAVSISDTLIDYTEQVMAITNDKTTYIVPQNELAFAETLKKAYHNNTLLAQTSNKKPVFDNSVPIVVIDKSSQGQQSTIVNQPQQKQSESYSLVEPVAFSMTKYPAKDPGTELLSVDFVIDNRVEASPLVQMVNHTFMSNSINKVNEDLEINFNADKVTLAETYPLIEPVYSKVNTSGIEPDETSLVINFNIDAIKPAELVSQVDNNLDVQNISLKDEQIEISNSIDKTEPVKVLPVVEQIHSREVAISGFDDDIELNMNFGGDEFVADKLVVPVNHNLPSQNPTDQDIEIVSYTELTEQSVVLALIEPVNSNYKTYSSLLGEAEIELNFSVDQSEVKKVIQQIPITSKDQIKISEDEVLEIANYNDKQNPTENTFNITPIAINDPKSQFLFMDESLEINFTVDKAEISKLVNPISYNENISFPVIESETEINFSIDEAEGLAIINPVYPNIMNNKTINPVNEVIELGFDVDSDNVPIYNIVQMVYYKEPVSSVFREELPLEFNFIIDQTFEAYAQVSPVYINRNNLNFLNLVEETIEINTDIDKGSFASSSNIEKVITSSAEIAVTNSKLKSIELKTGIKNIESKDEIYYFREAVMQANGIETNKSDAEILAKALNNPDELSYEELIYAANLTNVQEQKIAIYNVAFVHIDRDWRAFNNAGVTAIHLDDLSMANCYLYQASLLSANNGNIQNNMGILYCHQNQIEKAENYFIAASKLGYDAQYNLNLMNAIANMAGSAKNTKEEKVRNAEKSEDAVVDIMDYKATHE